MISAADAAAQYGVQLARILAAIRSGLLHEQTRPGGLVLIDEQELLQLLERSEKR